MPEETGLIVLEKINPKEVLTTGKGLDEVLAAIREKSFSMGQSVEEKEDRENIRSTANNIAKSKTFLVARANEIKAPHKKVIDEVNANVKKIKPTLDALKKEYRQPLTDWEDHKKIREAQEAKALQEKIDKRMNTLSGYNAPLPYQEVATMSDEDYETHLEESHKVWEKRIAEEKRVAAEQKAEAERLEKERLEFEEKQRAEQAERDKIVAEQQAALDKANAEIAAKQAEIDRKEAEIKAKEDAEREKEEAELAEKENERLKQEADERAEALKPEKQKCIDWVELIRGTIPTWPDLENDVLRVLISKATHQIENVLTNFHRDIEEL